LTEKSVEHIKIAEESSVFVLAPATANIIGKLANGIADDLLTTTFLASVKPKLICPSMNTNMWMSPVVQENINKLIKLGYVILSPEEGNLACGYKGVGRLRNTDSIFTEIKNILFKSERLHGKKIIVTAGGTMEPIDAVRVITNHSSGKMGAAIARVALYLGAEVLLLRAKSAATLYSSGNNFREKIFETTEQLSFLIQENVRDFDYIFHTAAVSDFQMADKFDGKIDSKEDLTMKLIPQPKIINRIKKWNPKIILIGFKAVYKKNREQIIKIGMEKLKESGADFIVANDIGRMDIGFTVDYNEVYLLSKKGLVSKIKKTVKLEVAQKLVDLIV
jgi:phosphopantothenoylcysteine decarboxylase/phosphopantothenate--cysteine ligase